MNYKIDVPGAKVVVRIKKSKYFDHISGKTRNYCIASFRIGRKVYNTGGETEGAAYSSAVSSLLANSSGQVE